MVLSREAKSGAFGAFVWCNEKQARCVFLNRPEKTTENEEKS